MSRFVAAALAMMFSVCAFAQQKRIYIANDDHTDYFWTADDVAYRAAFISMLNYYMDLTDATGANPPEFQSRFNCDGNFWLWEYERNQPTASWNRLIGQVRSGHISVPLNALVSCYGGVPAEAVLRGMYYAGRLERREDLRFPLAYAMENQTLPLGLASLWAGSGAQWSWRGICGCVSRINDAFDRENDIYWYTGLDGQRVLMKWNSLLGGTPGVQAPNQAMGGYAECFNPPATVGYVSSNADFQLRYPYDVIGAFGHGWDNLQTTTDEFVLTAIGLSDASRQVIISNEQDFFADFESAYGNVIPSETRTYGNEWDLYCASMAEVSARVKRSVERLRGAEALATLVSLENAAFLNGREAARDLAFMNLGLYWEHDWTADGPVPASARAAWQRRIESELRTYVDQLQNDGVAALGALIPAQAGETRCFVFNPLTWSRTGPADFALPGGVSQPLHVIDVESGAAVPSQVVNIDGVATIRIWAENIPPVGYKVYELRSGAGPVFTPAGEVLSGGGGTPVNRVYSIPSNDRDAMSTLVTGAGQQVRISGYNPPTDFANYISTDDEQQSAAVAFTIDVPIGATVQSATLTLRPTPLQSVSPVGGFEIRAYNVVNLPPFVGGASGDLANFAPTTPNFVIWPVQSWLPGLDQTSPNLASLLQQIVDRPDYVPGATVGFVLTEGTLGAFRFYGFEDFSQPGGTPARLNVTYVSDSAPTSALIQNARYRLRITPTGAIDTLIDRTQANREYAQGIDGRFLNDLGGAGGLVGVESSGPVSLTLRAESSSPLQHITRVTLFRDGQRIEIENRITQNFTDVRSYDFSFNLAQPHVRHEEVGAILDARLTSFGGDYSPRNARYDWLTLNHFADMTTGAGNFGVTLSNEDCYFFRLGASTVSVLDPNVPRISPLIGGRVDSPLGIPNQGGDSLFRQRFALRTHTGYDPSGAMRFALNHQNPFVCGLVTGAAGSTGYPADRYSLFTVSNAAVLGWALKPAEEGIEEGLILRLWNVTDSPQSTTVQFPAGLVAGAVQTTHIETDLVHVPMSAGALNVTLGPKRMQTYRLVLAPSILGDLNCDGIVTVGDIAPFVLAVTNPTAYEQQFPNCEALLADINGDGAVTVGDIAPFVALVTGGG
ncbi:MAG: hypothetical protein SF069_00915 [Phycisphaerae bacterium]|nr:hypothetical protein [Phycisphaerae bacterium]